MLPRERLLIQRHVDFCQKHHLQRHERADQAIIEALMMAEELAGDREADEAAALLYALTKQVRVLRESWGDFPILEAQKVARSNLQSFAVAITDVPLENVRLRICARSATFEELRDFVAARVRPLHLRLVR
jgi:hypothetical protein